MSRSKKLILSRIKSSDKSMASSNYYCYTCNFCDLKFKTSDDLDLHNQLHTGSGEFSCPLCKETFVDLTELQLHDLQHSLEEIKEEKRIPLTVDITFIQPASSFACKICNKVFLSDEELFDHVTQHADTENIISLGLSKSSDEYETDEDVKPPTAHTVYKKPNRKVTLIPTVKHWRTDDHGPFECKTCKRVFNGPDSLNRHQRRFHLNKGKYVCTVCSKTFVNLSLLCEHSLQHYETKSREFECYICKKCFSSSMLLLEHFLVSHVCESQYFCKACFKFFSGKDDLNDHMEDHIAAYNCNTCKKWYKTQSKLNNHRCVFVGPRPYPCKICGKRFSRVYHLQRHCHLHDRELGVGSEQSVLNRHKKHSALYHLEHQLDLSRRKKSSAENAESDLDCLKKQNISVKTTNSAIPYRISSTKNYVTGESSIVSKKFECYICNNRWFSFKKYKQHFLTVHQDVTFNACHICSKQFTKSSKVKRHLLVHSKARNFKCEICCKAFVTRSTMNRHKKKHAAEESIYQCSKIYVKKNVQKHVKMHDMPKHTSFKCTVCEKKFPEEKLLNAHILAFHDFFKAFQCILCKKRFKSHYNLKRHMAVHTGLKRYKCFKCNTLFSDESNLKRHVSTHEKLKPYPCYFCDKFFTRNYHRKKHLANCFREKKCLLMRDEKSRLFMNLEPNETFDKCEKT